MTMLLILTAAVFTAIAIFTPQVLARFLTRRRLRRPHAALIAIFRLWFAALALATFWLLLHPAHSSAMSYPTTPDGRILRRARPAVALHES